MFDYEGSLNEKFYNGVESIPVGQTVTFAQLADTGFDVKKDYQLVDSANKRLLEKQNKMLVNIRGVGYKMAEAKEQIKHAWIRKDRAARQIKKAVRETTYIDTSKLTAEERKTLIDRQIYLTRNLKSLRAKNIASQNASMQAIVKVEKSVEIQKDSLSRLDRLIAEAESIRQQLKV